MDDDRGEDGGGRAPGPRGLGSLRAILRFLRDPLGYLVWLRERYGDVVRTAAGPVVFHTFFEARALRHIFVEHAGRFTKRGVLDELAPVLGEGLLRSEGEQWRARRHLLGALFTSRRVEAMAEEMDDELGALLKGWGNGGWIDAAGESGRLALAIVGRTLLGTSLRERADEISGAVERVSRLAMRRRAALIRVPLGAPTPTNLAYRRAIRTLHGVVGELAQARGSPVLAQLGEGPSGGTGLTSEEVRDELMTLLLAGHETTASTLTWALAHLARDPSLQERVRDEARTSIGSAESSKLPLTEALVSEVLRVYPPGWMLVRRAEEADTIGGYAVPRHSLVVAPVYALHRHPAHWREPGRFHPERFIQDGAPDPMVYMPFGTGARRCIGESFARLELRLALTRIVGKFRLQAGGTLPEALPLTTLRARGPVMVEVRPV